MRRKSSGLMRSRFGVEGKLMIGPPRPSRPPDKMATRSCSSEIMSIARTPLSIVRVIGDVARVKCWVLISSPCFRMPLNLTRKLNGVNLISLAVPVRKEKRKKKMKI